MAPIGPIHRAFRFKSMPPWDRHLETSELDTYDGQKYNPRLTLVEIAYLDAQRMLNLDRTKRTHLDAKRMEKQTDGGFCGLA